MNFFSAVHRAAEALPTAVNSQLAPEVSAGNVALLIIYLALILVGAYFVTKFIARRALTQGMKKKPGKSVFRARTNEPGTLLSVADRIAVDKTKTIMVIEFQGKYYLMSTTEHDIKCIDKTPIPETIQTEEQHGEGAAGTASYIYAGEESKSPGFIYYLKDLFYRGENSNKNGDCIGAHLNRDARNNNDEKDSR